MQMKMQQQQHELDEILKQEREDKALLQSMLEDVANNLDQVNQECQEWKARCERAEADLHTAHSLMGVAHSGFH